MNETATPPWRPFGPRTWPAPSPTSSPASPRRPQPAPPAPHRTELKTSRGQHPAPRLWAYTHIAAPGGWRLRQQRSGLGGELADFGGDGGALPRLAICPVRGKGANGGYAGDWNADDHGPLRPPRHLASTARHRRQGLTCAGVAYRAGVQALCCSRCGSVAVPADDVGESPGCCCGEYEDEQEIHSAADWSPHQALVGARGRTPLCPGGHGTRCYRR